MKLKNIYTQFILSFIIFALTPFLASADNVGQGNSFYVDPGFSSSSSYNYQISATLLRLPAMPITMSTIIGIILRRIAEADDIVYLERTGRRVR